MDNNILTLFTSEDRTEIRTAIKEIIIEQVKYDFENNSNYLLDPSQVEDMVADVVDEVKEEIRDILKEKLMKEMEEKINTIVN